MKKISVYVKGDRNSTAYYRIYQFFDKLDDVDVKYNVMYPQFAQKHFMPIAYQNIVIKTVVYLLSYFRVLKDILRDLIKKPDKIVIHKRIISRFMPLSFKLLLALISERTAIIWDFDDDVVRGGEMSQKTFLFISRISFKIVVTHDYLKSLVPDYAKKKVVILPTTDGDLYKFTEIKEIVNTRLRLFDDSLILAWIGTSPNLINFNHIIEYIDEAARIIKIQSDRNVNLKIVCDQPLLYKTKNLQIENIKWSREAAIDVLKYSHIGIMPLEDTVYNKGKGGFKLVQYMSIGLPCIGSNVGYNAEIIGDGCGKLCTTGEDWVDAIRDLSSLSVWQDYSKNANLYWSDHFSYVTNLEYWKKLICVNHL